MKTVVIHGGMSTPKDLEPFENKEIEKVILRFETGIFEEDIVCYPAYVVAEKLDEVKKDINELRSDE